MILDGKVTIQNGDVFVDLMSMIRECKFTIKKANLNDVRLFGMIMSP